jgi:hypothetical protein
MQVEYATDLAFRSTTRQRSGPASQARRYRSGRDLMGFIPAAGMIDSRVIPTVMAWLGHAIHDLAAYIKERRGWPAGAGHDGLSGR